MSYDWILDGGYLPQAVIRIGIRKQLRERLASIESKDTETACARKQEFVRALRTRPIAIETDTANQQHYEVSTPVFSSCLGPRLKYSSCLYPTGTETLAEAEDLILESYLEKADLKDGQDILDLGCGWGSGALFVAEKLPNSKVTGFSNSRTQKEYIDAQAAKKGLTNLTIVTGDVVHYEFSEASFDRIMSIELYEHMKNYELLNAKMARWLKSKGKLFLHIFSHKDTPYDFEEGWMTTHFFTGGTMSSADLMVYFQRDLNLEKQWWLSGTHYAQTCEHWLQNLNSNQDEIMPALEETYGKENALTWYHRWQVFYIACAELFAYDNGNIWGVSHYLFEKP